eukprot:1549405-Prorocentrum_lima.AAC.1
MHAGGHGEWMPVPCLVHPIRPVLGHKKMLNAPPQLGKGVPHHRSYLASTHRPDGILGVQGHDHS